MEKCLCCRERKRNSYGNICENAKLAICLERERLYRAGLERAIEMAEKMHSELLPLEQSSMSLFQDACNNAWV